MSEERLSMLIEDFSYRNLNLFFRDKCENYAETPEDLSQYDDERFSDFSKLGEIRFDDGEKLVVTTSRVSSDLSERSGKKAQYEKAKRILKELAVYDASFFIFHDDTGSFRFSLVYGQAEGTRKSWSNFRRFTYFVSRESTNRTFRIRVGGCIFSSLEVVKDAFSVEKVNKEFYNHVAMFFYRLVGYKCKREMTLPSVSDDDKETYQKFAVRLIGRAIFCWFLKHKKSGNGVSLIPESVLSSGAVKHNSQYYHSTLEKLFFEVLNTLQEQRHKNILPDADKIPFLNGGLFEPHDDFYDNGELQYNLVIQDIWFEQFFEILEQYNFTIDENSTVDADVSVDPEMLGRIFENLLAEVNPQTGETARKATGSYYTPRTIVDYMVDQSLKQYLITKTKIEEDRVTALLSYEAPEISLSESEKGSIISALDEIKIIDPACGSGAFPMGILHKMLLVLQKADPDLRLWLKNHLGNIEPGIFRDRLLERIRNENWEYVRKLLIIQKSIYGVDIQTIAVEISKLRFFLSLIVDEQIDDLKDNRGVEALPNLEFKFVAANSLIGLPPVMNRQVGLGIVNEEVIRLKKLRNRYLRSYGTEKKQIEEDFLKTRGKLIEQSIKWGGKDALALQLANWNPFSNEASEWFDPDWMFGVEEGFDIVIANPPYLGEKGHKDIFRIIRQNTLKEYYQAKMDIFYFFFHLAINMGNNNAQIAFITTNYYPTATFANKLRQDLKQRTIIRKFVNFNELRIFESAQGQHNMITVLSKGHDDSKTVDTCITKRKGDATPQTLQEILAWQDNQTSYYRKKQNEIYEGKECYIRLYAGSDSGDDTTQSILNKIKHGNSTLGQYCNINRGVDITLRQITRKHLKKYPQNHFTLGEQAFTVSKESFDNALLRKYSDILKKYIKSTDIFRYGFNWSNEILLYMKWDTDITRFPEIRKHLQKFKPILEAQRKNYNEDYPWYALHRPRNQHIFESEKILVPYRSRKNTFGYSLEPTYGSDDVYFITDKGSSVHLKYVLALLNSKLYFLWLYHKGKRKGEILELYSTPLSEVPIKQNDAGQNSFIDLVDKIITITKEGDYLSSPIPQAKVKVLELQIDRMVYELYGLTPEEIAVVEGSSSE